MSGTREGGLKAKATNLNKDPDFYRKVGQIGGLVKVPKGFAINRELAREAGKKGGRISKRAKAIK